MSITRRFANLGTALDSASTSHFLSVLNKEGLFRSVLWTEIAERPNVLDSADVSSIITADVDKAFVDSLGVDAATLDGQGPGYYLSYDNLIGTPEAPLEGTVSPTITTDTLTSIVDSDYVQRRQSGAGFSLYEYTATDGQTTFADSDIKGSVLAYADGYVLVHYNGVLLSTTEYTATNGNDVILQDAADSGAVVMIAAFVPGQPGVVNPYAPAPTISIPEGDSAGSYTAGGSGVWYGDRALISGGMYHVEGAYIYSVTTSSLIDEFSISNGSNATQWGAFTIGGGAATPYHSHTSFTDGSRALFAGGVRPGSDGSYIDEIYYRDTNNAGSISTVFGSLSYEKWQNSAGASDGTNGYIMAGQNYATPKVGQMDTVVIQTTGDATDFGELGFETSSTEASGNNSTIIIPISRAAGPVYGHTTKIKYFATGNLGNAIDFGFLTAELGHVGAITDETYCVMPTIAAKYGETSNVIEYVTIATPGNATDFGDLLSARGRGPYMGATTGDGTYGVITSNWTERYGKVIEKVTIATPGNAVEHGGLERLQMAYNHSMCSGS